jgi:PhnB protein
MQVQPYLFFEGRCEEALAFYQRVLGAEPGMVLHYSDAPMAAGAPEGCAMPTPPADKIMHAELKIGTSTLMCSDGMCSGTPKFEGCSLTLDCTSDAEAARLFDAIVSNDGKVLQPLMKTFFASSFAMTQDRFGVDWMIIHRTEQQ